MFSFMWAVKLIAVDICASLYHACQLRFHAKDKARSKHISCLVTSSSECIFGESVAVMAFFYFESLFTFCCDYRLILKCYCWEKKNPTTFFSNSLAYEP